MSIRVISLVLGVKLGSPARKVVAIKLADCASDDGSRVYPSVDRIAAETEVSVRTVQYVLREFQDEGLLVLVAEGGKGPRNTNEYRFDLAKLIALPVSYSPLEQVVAKGAKSAPIKKEPRVQPASAKGATSVKKGCTPCTQSFTEPSMIRQGAQSADGLGLDLVSAAEALVEPVPDSARRTFPKPAPRKPQRVTRDGPGQFVLTHDVREKARAAARGWDIDAVFVDWLAMNEGQDLINPEAAFLGFCRHKGAHPDARQHKLNCNPNSPVRVAADSDNGRAWLTFLDARNDAAAQAAATKLRTKGFAFFGTPTPTPTSNTAKGPRT